MLKSSIRKAIDVYTRREIDKTVDMKPTNNEPNFNSESRMMRGEKIAKEKTILENADGSFSVPSQSVEEIAYLVRLIDGKYVCNCLDFKFNHVEACKHVFATKTWIASQVEIKKAPKPKVFADDAVQCPKCASIRVVKFGHDSGKQVFKCKDCSHEIQRVKPTQRKPSYTPRNSLANS